MSGKAFKRAIRAAVNVTRENIAYEAEQAEHAARCAQSRADMDEARRAAAFDASAEWRAENAVRDFYYFA
jgi:hypothetical protein